MKVLLSKKSKYVVEDDVKELHTKDGIIKIEENRAISHLGIEFSIVEPNLLDILKKLKRGPQVILPKDAAMILAYTGIKQNSRILEGGTGNAFLTIFLCWYLKPCKIFTYENDERFYKIAKENIEKSGLKEFIELKFEDFGNFEEKDIDLAVLDLKNSEKYVKKVYEALKNGAWLVIYTPNVEGLIRNFEEVKKYNFTEIKVTENIVREWNLEKLRPKSKGLMHTGFIIFARKVC
jgi:tRNA (adenine57-N1/adenine58-N1)-methyltransferase